MESNNYLVSHPQYGEKQMRASGPTSAASFEHFTAIIQNSNDAIISKTISGKVTSWNSGAEALFGYAADEMLGRPMVSIFPPEKMDEESLILEKIVAGECVDNFETTRVHKSGQIIHVSVTISPIRDDLGSVIGASKIARDITERKRAESRLKMAATVFENTHEGIIILNARGRIIETNEAFSRISGHRRDDVFGKSADKICVDLGNCDLIGEIRDALQHKGTYQGEARCRRKDGHSYTSWITVSRIENKDGIIDFYVAMIADITPLREKQDLIERMAFFDPLTDLPNRRLLSDRLRQAMALARRKKHSVGVLYIDLDGFKNVNDVHGHHVGDQLLVRLTQRIKRTLRDMDTLARIGGDEFVVVLPDAGSAEECSELAARILRVCSEPVKLSEHLARVSASIGMTIFPQDDVDADQLLRHADRAMYEAKLTGKNRLRMFNQACAA